MSPRNKLSSLDLVLIIIIGLLPFSFALNPGLNIDLSIIRIIIPILFLIWLLGCLFKKRLILDSRFRAWLLIFIFLLSLTSVLWATNSLKAWRKVLFLGSLFPIYWVIFPILKRRASLNLFFKIIFWTALASALIGLVQFLAQFIFGLEAVFKTQAIIAPFFLGNNFSEVVLRYNSWLVNLNGATIFRAIGLFPDPHLFSLFLNISLPIGIYLFLKEKKKVFLAGSLIILLSSLLTFSRAGYLSLILAFLFFYLCFLRKKDICPSRRRFAEVENISLALVVIVFFLIPNPINQRFFSIFSFQENSISERLNLWKTGIEITKNNFWTGVGIGNLSEEVQPFSDQRIPIYAHNLFLDFSSEIGFLGGLAVFLVIVAPIIKFFKHPTDKTLLIATIFIIILTHSMFETPFYSTRLLPLILSLLAI